MTTKPADRYHHGDLREALLAAGEAVLAERGLEDFTLRECARRAGVSHAAPAHHFGDAAGFLAELAAVGFDRLTAAMEERRAGSGPEPLAQLHAIGRGYIAFAVRNRALFQIMFRHDGTGVGSANLQRAGGAAFGVLQAAMARVLAAHRPAQAPLPSLALAWSAVHGFATLLIERQLDACLGQGGIHDLETDLGGAMLTLMTDALAGPPTIPAGGNS